MTTLNKIELNKQFIIESIRGNVERMRSYLDLGADINATKIVGELQPSKKPAIWWSGFMKKKEAFYFLLDRGANIHMQDINDYDYPNLLGAVLWDLDLLKHLIAMGLDPYDQSPFGANLLSTALSSKNMAVLGFLGEIGVSANPVRDTDAGGYNLSTFSILYHAGAYHDVALLDLAVNLGVDVNTFTEHASLLHGACSSPLILETNPTKFNLFVSRLVFHGFYVNSQNDVGETALHVAIENHRPYQFIGPSMIRTLLAAGVDPRIKNYNGKTPIDIASLPMKKLLRSAQMTEVL
jgi:ankyrin repeat protein